MKRIANLLCLFFVLLMLCSCPNWYKPWEDTKYFDTEAEITFSPSRIEPSSDLTIKCSNAPIFNKSSNQMTDEQWCLSIINFCTNEYRDKTFYYNTSFGNGGTLVQKKSNYEATFFVKSNATNYYLYFDNKFFGSNEDKHYFCDTGLYVKYPTDLTTDKTSYKIGDKVTITSSKPFFDKSTFSKEKVQKMLLYGYHIVWITGYNLGITEKSNKNTVKQPVLSKYYDFDDLSADTISFIVPDYAWEGSFEVINEGGIICDNTNDLNIKGNVNGAPAYFSTTSSIKIERTKKE